MASIKEEIRNGHSYYRLVKWVNGKSQIIYLGTKPPIPIYLQMNFDKEKQ